MSDAHRSMRHAAWWERLSENCYQVAAPQLLREMQRAAPAALGALLSDLEAPLEVAFEDEAVRWLNRGACRAFVPAATLLPVMMQRYGLAPLGQETSRAAQALRRTCNACPAAGRCWRALRRGASAEECRPFCANAVALDQRRVALV